MVQKSLKIPLRNIKMAPKASHGQEMQEYIRINFDNNTISFSDLACPYLAWNGLLV